MLWRLSVGASLGAPAIAEKISKIRIVTDMSIVQGKAVTQFIIPDTDQAKALDRTIASVKTQAEKAVRNPQVQEEKKEVVSKFSKSVLLISLMGLLLLGVGAFASMRGALRPHKPGPIRKKLIKP